MGADPCARSAADCAALREPEAGLAAAAFAGGPGEAATAAESAVAAIRHARPRAVLDADVAT